MGKFQQYLDKTYIQIMLLNEINKKYKIWQAKQLKYIPVYVLSISIKVMLSKMKISVKVCHFKSLKLFRFACHPLKITKLKF